MTLNDEEATALLQDAYDKMASERQEGIRALRRRIRYEWKYRDGKKKVLKAGTGLSLGMGFVLIGATTHGVGVPLVIGLAAAGMASGVLNDFAFAKLSGRDKIGAKKTWRWRAQQHDLPWTRSGIQEEEERAHKTLRRATQHYLVAWLRAQPLRDPRTLPQQFDRCDQVHEHLKVMLPILLPFEKAWLYLQPAIELSEDLLALSKKTQKACRLELDNVKTWKHGSVRCASADCYKGKLILGRPQVVMGLPLWVEDQYDAMQENLREARETIDQCIFAREVVDLADPFSIRKHWSLRANDAVKLYDHAAKKYNARTMATKVWHGISNDWHRKTKQEKGEFVIKHIVSAAVRVGTLGIGLTEVFNGFEPLTEIGENFIEEAIEEVHDGGDDDALDVNDDNLENRQAEIAAGLQDSLRSSALHMCEVFRIVNRIQLGDAMYSTCDEATAYCRTIFKINYHLRETQRNLGPTIDKVHKLSLRIGTDLGRVRAHNSWLGATTSSFLAAHPPNHTLCTREKCINNMH